MTRGDDRRIPVYAGEPLQRLLAHGGEARSARINAAVERYLAIVADELRRLDLTRAEWCAVMDVLNGAQIEAVDQSMWLAAWASVADAGAEIEEKWGVDCQRLAQRIRGLPVAGRAAVWEAAVRFWSRAELPTDQALVEAGVTPRE